jgi:hypothetical protein
MLQHGLIDTWLNHSKDNSIIGAVPAYLSKLTPKIG